jgi:putative glycosyltransferase (TIGR04372 family)
LVLRAQPKAVRVLQFFLLVLARLGVVQVLQLSKKGRLTQFVERVEPSIRRKLIRFKWFPPVLLVVNPTDSPNIAVEEYFASQVVFVTLRSSGLLAEAMRAKIQELTSATRRPFQFLKRPGSPWGMSPSVRRRDDWTHETNALLEQMQVTPGKPIVLLAVRDATYYRALCMQRGEAAGPETTPDTFIRNPNLETYSVAIAQLQAHGYIVVYFGFPTSPLPPSLIGKVVDYSGQFRSPRGDLLLGRYCRMLSTGGSGTWAFASLFNRPVAYSNTYLPFVGGVHRRDRIMPQLMFSQEKQRLLSFREMVDSKWEYTFESNCKRDGITLVKNSPEEIAELVLETLYRDSGSFVETSEDKVFAARFSKIQALSPLPRERHGAIATTFLRRHAQLLE